MASIAGLFRRRTFAALYPCAGVLALMLVFVMLPQQKAQARSDERAEGAELFATRGCVHCHGASGEGTEKGPSLRNLRRKRSAKEIQEQIQHGGGGMPAFGETLTPNELESLVTFVRAKKWISAAPATPTTTAPPPATTPQ